MEPSTSMSESQSLRVFYLPAMATLSKGPGRIGRRLARIGRTRHAGGSATTEPTRAFYVPGMAVISAVPGRVERFVTATLRDRGVASRANSIGQRVREFYLPAVFRR